MLVARDADRTETNPKRQASSHGHIQTCPSWSPSPSCERECAGSGPAGRRHAHQGAQLCLRRRWASGDDQRSACGDDQEGEIYIRHKTRGYQSGGTEGGQCCKSPNKVGTFVPYWKVLQDESLADCFASKVGGVGIGAAAGFIASRVATGSWGGPKGAIVAGIGSAVSLQLALDECGGLRCIVENEGS